MSEAGRDDRSGLPFDEAGILPAFTTRRILEVVVAVVMAVVVILGVQRFVHRNRSEGEKLGDALGERCDHVGLIAAFGGRSNLYRCRFGYETLHCAIWVDGAAYDVTRKARAIFRLQHETAAC